MAMGQGLAVRRGIIWGGGVLLILVMAALLVAAAFPFDYLKDRIARRVGEEMGATISIGSIERREALSFSPTVAVHQLIVQQPPWAGSGEMVHAEEIVVRFSIASFLLGRGFKPDAIVARNLSVALVRDANGRANWEQSKHSERRAAHENGLRRLIIQNGRVSLRDEKRGITLAGHFTADAKGVFVDAEGQFHGSPAHLSLRGGRITGVAADAPYPFTLALKSPLLALEANGTMRGALNTSDMIVDVHSAAPSLKFLDYVIEAGLFGTRPIDFRGRVHHAGRDWLIKRMTGRIGRSTFVAKANVLKRVGRTKIDADIRFSQFDFDDLSDARGRAEAEAIERRIGPRVLPATRINISKIGPTDAVIHFRANRLLLTDSVFQSLRGVLRLDGKLLTIADITAGMTNGTMTGSLSVDQRGTAPKPRLSINFAVADGRLESLIGGHAASGPMRAKIKLAGVGDTVREALAHADGRAGVMVRGGGVKRVFAAVLGQDLGKAIGSALGDKAAEVPLRCLAVGFAAKDGLLIPSPFVVGTAISSGRGQGRLSLATERIALTIRGRSRDPSALRIVDPIEVGGTFSRPAISIAGEATDSRNKIGAVISAVGKSIGHALGLNKSKSPEKQAPETIDCEALARQIF